MSEASPQDNEPKTERYRFTIGDLLWFTALVACGMGTFLTEPGGLGELSNVGLGLLLLVACAYRIFANKIVPATAAFFNWTRLIYFCFIAMLLAALVSANGDKRPLMEDPSRSPILVMQAIYSANEIHLSRTDKPLPAYTIDQQGEPLHSWRLLAPVELGCPPKQFGIDLTLPWDDPKNLQAFKTLPNLLTELVYGPINRSSPPSESAQLLAVVDEQAFWKPPGSEQADSPVADSHVEVTDSPYDTIIVLQDSSTETPWYEPRDLSFDEAVDLLASDRGGETIRHAGFYRTACYANMRKALFADGHADWIPLNIDRKTARALLTVAGGEQLGDWQADYETSGENIYQIVGYEYHWDKIGGTAFFIILVVMPRFWARPQTHADSARLG